MDKTKLKKLLIEPTCTIKQAMQRLTETAEKILFVVDARDVLLGTITDGDIRRAVIQGIEFSQSVEQVMYRRFVSVAPDAAARREDLRALMLETKIEQVPVLDNEGRITDVVLWTDILGDIKRKTPQRRFDNQVVIMAGGKGTRLDPFTRILPKPLIPIGDRPIIEIIMEKFYCCGFSRFIYTLNYKKEYIKLFLTENQFPYSVEWVEEQDFLGTAGSLSLLKGRLTDSFFVINCDTILDIDMAQVMSWHKEHSAAMTIIGCHNEVKIPFGILEMKEGRLHKIVEKPVHDIVINTGVYIMEPAIVSYISENTCMDMNELIDIVIKKEKISIYTICDGWHDIGQWSEYKKSIEAIERTKNV